MEKNIIDPRKIFENDKDEHHRRVELDQRILSDCETKLEIINEDMEALTELASEALAKYDLDEYFDILSELQYQSKMLKVYLSLENFILD